MRGPSRRAPRALLLSLPVLLVAAAALWWAWSGEPGSATAPGSTSPVTAAPADALAMSRSSASDDAAAGVARREEVPAAEPSALRAAAEVDDDDPRRYACARAELGRRGGPAVGAQVEVSVRSEEGSTRRYRGTTDATGFFCIECAVPRHWTTDDGLMLGVEWGQRIWAPGWQANTAGPYLFEEQPTESRARFTLNNPGGMVRGRVLDADGHGVAGAGVTLVRADADGGPTLDAVGTTKADSNGDYDLGYRKAGRYVVLARHLRGFARSPACTLDPLRQEVLDDLVLGGSGSIAGRAVTPDGDPIVDLQLLAVSRDAVDPGAWEVGAPLPGEVQRSLDLSQSPDGLVLAWAVTDEQGGFRFGGLRPGAFLLCPQHPGLPTTRCPANTGDEHVRVELEHHQIEVELLLDTTLAKLEAERPMGRKLVYCNARDIDFHPDPDAFHHEREDGLIRQNDSTMGSTVRFEVLPGRRYEIGITDTSLYGGRVVHAATREVEVPAGQYRTRVRLLLSAVAAGSLVLDVRGTLDRNDLVRALVLREDTGAVVATLEGNAAEPISSDALPAGDYRVRATLRAAGFFSSDAGPWGRTEARWQELRVASVGVLPWPDWLTAASVVTGFHLNCEATVQVRAGEAQSVDLDFPRGGRLLLRVPAAVEGTDPAAGREGSDPDALSELRGAATLPATAFFGEGRRPIEFGRVYPEGSPEPVAAFDADGAAWFLGDVALPPGPVHVVVRTTGGEFTADAPVAAGRLCVVELR